MIPISPSPRLSWKTASAWSCFNAPCASGTEQVVLKSKEAFGRIQFVSAEPVESSTFYPQKLTRDRQARGAYFKMLEETPVAGAVYMVNILSEQWDANDPRL